MVHNNKILTVSYGTFSCTLEGFDDSFGTMKAIAEYFRDLASDDRYFGAEPPQPDAEMLARIAQREISRQVDAHTESNGIVLRAKDLAGAGAPVGAATVAAAVTVEATTEPAAPVAAPAPAPAPAPVEQEIAPVPPVEQPAAEAAQPTPVPTETVAEPESVEHVVTVEQNAAPVLHVLADDHDDDNAPRNDATDESLAAFMAGTAANDQPEFLQAEDVTPPRAAPAPDSIAAKLQRIRAVVSQNESTGRPNDFSEDEHADAFMSETADDLADVIQDHEELEPIPQVSHDDISKALDRFDAAVEDAIEDDSTGVSAAPDKKIDFAGIDQGDDTYEDDDQDDAIDLSEFLSTNGDSQPDDVAEDVAEDVTGPSPRIDENAAVSDDEGLFQALDDDTAEAIEEDEIANILDDDATDKPRVVKVKRADLEAAIAAGDIEEIEDAAKANFDSSLTDEEEADLRRELAEVEAELVEPSKDNIETIEEFEIVDDDVDTSGQYILPNAAEEVEEDLSRLMAAADEKMEEPESSSSRETYYQLRAAVAAAEAERSAGGDVGNETADESYREDLASVVRPRRPVAGGASRPSRPDTDTRPAPLKLVAEQRVDNVGGSASRGPVRPRRVATPETDASAAPVASGTEGGFEAFAQEMGVTELPELLEAAAAYMSFVEGRDQFSRPQLMNKVRQIESQDFNREDGLRSFGQLLRDGKIEKTGGGRFTASGDIGFRPDERAVG